MSKWPIASVLILIIAGNFRCGKNYLTYDLPYEGDRIVIYSFFDPEHVFNAELFKTKPAVSDTTKDIHINNALVIVTNASGLLDTLLGDGSGIYTGHITPEIAVNYRITASVPGYPEATSAWSHIPEYSLDQIEFDQFEKIEEIQMHLTYVGNIRISNFDTSSLYYYGFEPENTYDIFLVPDQAIFKKCGVIEHDLLGQAFSGDCLEDTDDSFTIDVLNNVEPTWPSFKLNFYILSPELFQYMKTWKRHFTNDIIIYAEPSNVYTNIENGYGIFAGRNMISKIF